jgi:hypothetical protein
MHRDSRNTIKFFPSRKATPLIKYLFNCRRDGLIRRGSLYWDKWGICLALKTTSNYYSLGVAKCCLLPV